MTRRLAYGSTLGAAALLLNAPTASAEPITVAFTGTVDGRQNGVFAGQGPAVSGTFTYDLDMQPTPGQDGPDYNRFQSTDAANQLLDWAFTLTNGDATRSTRDFEGDPNSERGFVVVITDQLIDEQVSLSGASSIILGTPPDDYFLYHMFFELTLLDTQPTFDRDGVAPGSNNLTGEMPDLSSFDLGLFESRSGSVSITGPNPPGPATNLIGQLDFSIDTLTLIPEPGGLAWLAGAALLHRRARGRGSGGRRAD